MFIFTPIITREKTLERKSTLALLMSQFMSCAGRLDLPYRLLRRQLRAVYYQQNWQHPRLPPPVRPNRPRQLHFQFLTRLLRPVQWQDSPVRVRCSTIYLSCLRFCSLLLLLCTEAAEVNASTNAEALARSTPLAEELGALVASQLCEEIGKGGVVDSGHQPMMLLMMMLCPEDVSKIRLGKLSPYTYAPTALPCLQWRIC